MIFAGSLYGIEGPVGEGLDGVVQAVLGNVPNGLIFAASLFAILGAHEFGHYLAARYHKCAVTLPYFLPFPGSLFGTLGAFIRLKEPPRNRKVLLDIGLSGPLAGLIVAVPVLLIGLANSGIDQLPLSPTEAQGMIIEGNSILYLAAKYITQGELLPQPLNYYDLSPVVYWLRYFFLGTPAPYGGTDVILNHMAWAGWAGLLVTALNLIPAGQLDGGHTLFVLIGDTARRIWPIIVVALILLGFVWSGWFIWAVLIFLLGRTYARPRDEITPLDPRRRALAIFGLIVFVLVFIPVPLRIFGG
jgi:membrane-associated protease RseP (regulator of RpoE activity)